MKAFVLKSLNIPPVVVDVPLPGPLKNEVLVEVAYCGVNRVDLGLLSGRFGNSVSFPNIMGSEVVGTLSNGRKVAVNPYLHCDKCLYCRKKEYLLCNKGRPLLGIQKNGGYGQYVSVPRTNIVDIPESIPLSTAASLVLSASTAYRMVNTKAAIGKSDTVIITAAASGVGVYTTQLAKLNRSFVIGLTGSSFKAKEITRLGADKTVDYSRSGWVESLANLLKKRKANVLIDTVGGKILENVISLLSPAAKIVSCGATENPHISINLIDFYMKQKTLMGSSGFTNEDLKSVLQLAKNIKIKPVIDSVFNIDQIPEAWNKLKSRNVIGKIIVKIS